MALFAIFTGEENMLVVRRFLPPHLSFFLFLALLFTGAITPAHSQGSWQPNTTSDGTISVTRSPGLSQSAAWGTPQAATITNIFVIGNQTLTLTTSGTYHVRFNWVAPNGEPAPKNMIVQTVSNRPLA